MSACRSARRSSLLLIIVGISYRQTIKAYPHGGGSYIVAKDNLGDGPALTAGAALLADYTLTVAVSIAAAVAALISAFPRVARRTGSSSASRSSCW